VRGCLRKSGCCDRGSKRYICGTTASATAIARGGSTSGWIGFGFGGGRVGLAHGPCSLLSLWSLSPCRKTLYGLDTDCPHHVLATRRPRFEPPHHHMCNVQDMGITCPASVVFFLNSFDGLFSQRSRTEICSIPFSNSRVFFGYSF
jgi:hypothetical protein